MDYKHKLYQKYLTTHFRDLKGITKESFEHFCLVYKNTIGEYLPSDRDAKILELGCGAGHFLYLLKCEGYSNYLGIDISDDQVEFCRMHVTDKVIKADVIEFLRKNQDKWNLVVMLDFIEHFSKSEIVEILTLVYEALESEGSCIVKTPNMANIFGNFTRYIDFTHEVGFTDQSLTQILKAIGFKNIEIIPGGLKPLTIRGKLREILNRQMHLLLFKLFVGTKLPITFWRDIIAVAEK